MTGTQYTNVVHWTLANSPAADSAAAAKAVFNNMGVAFPNGSCPEILLTLLSEEYMGWMSCTCQQAREFANAGVATVGIDPSRVVVILPDQPADALLSGTAAETAYAREAGDLALTERASMQFFAYAAASTTTTRPPMRHRLLSCYQTENDCFKRAEPIGVVKGIVVHSTGVNNPTLKRYVDYPEEVGMNVYGNHWNQSGVDTMVHAFIGLDKNNKVAIVNTLPYSYACWGVGSGTNGSYNYAPNGHLQFEICEDGLTDSTYFNDAVFGAAAEYCAYLCWRFSLSPLSICSHKQAHDEGYGSNHGDPEHWLAKFGKTMSHFRNAVRDLLY